MRHFVLPVTHLAQNCTVFWCETTRQAAVVDPGGEVPRILEVLAREHLTLAVILVTHGHIDHVGGVADLAEACSAPIAGPHVADRFWIEGLATQGRLFGFAETRVFEPDRWLQHGDTVTFGEERLRVLHCPGHTPGHVVFHHPEEKLLHVGDVLFKGAVGRTDFPQGDSAALARSIRETLFPLGDDVAFISGHGPMSTLGDERRAGVLDWM
ncbi:MAG: MBL fold metallo-hydrolase [Zoogloeaceae bacterium]|jgi:glyoxylase-like metal-dependent hydrolase (beta-lactamase superfamily II)|nr:MBL fold metallo-hydrolase [Zoogloeaceae bacterium]